MQTASLANPEKGQLVDVSGGTTTGLPSSAAMHDAWRRSVAQADGAVPVPDLPVEVFVEYGDDSSEWAALTFEAGAEAWQDR
jgi:hypothetical protein